MDQNRQVDGMPQTIGRYQVQASIGFGAMGAVYKAFDPLIKRTLAIKTIRLDIPRGSPQYKSFLERFYHEARISGTLSHPNIVTLFDIGEEQGIPFLAMEYVEGETIASMIENGVKFDPERVIGLVSQIGSAIDYAHSRGVIHRDIKPSNLILAEGDRVKVTDFGIAKLVDAEMTQSGALLGTPSYMSPEQAMGDKLDGRSDIFSLGICAFEMLSGAQPFPGNNVTSILYKLVHVDPVEPPNLEMNGLVPQKWHDVFGRVLAKKPDDRYQTATEFVQDLEFCLGGWFGAVGEEGAAPATVILSASALAGKAGAPPRAPEPPAEVTKAIPRPRTSAPPAPAPPPAAPLPAEEKTVMMRAPVVPAPPTAPPVPPAAEDADAATVMIKAPAPMVDEPTARFAAPSAAAAAARPPAPETAPVARPSVPIPPPAAPAAPGPPKASGPSMLPLLLVAGAAVAFLIVGAFIVWKVLAGGRATVAETPTPAPTAAVTAPPTQAPTAEPTAAAAPGVLDVESDPAGALIYVNDEAKGVTPTQLTGLALGPHELRLELAGYETKSQTVELTSEAPSTRVTVALATPAPSTGTAEILSTPSGAAVAIAGKVVGRTPISGLSLKAGNYKVELRMEGFELLTMPMRVQPGQRTKLEAPLKAVAAATAPPTPKPEVIDFERVFEENEVDTQPRRVKGPASPEVKPKLKSGESITLVIQWVVTETGDNVEYKILESGGKQVDEAAFKMLRQQKYEPATKKGRPVKMRFAPRRFTFQSG